MREEEKQAIRASFAGKRVSQMTEIERKVFDEDFQYGVVTQSSHRHASGSGDVRKSSRLSVSGLFRRIGFGRK